MRRALRNTLAAIGSVIGLDEIVLVVGLILLACGFQQMPSWSAGSYFVPGVLLVWLTVPQRAGLVKRDPQASVRKRP